MATGAGGISGFEDIESDIDGPPLEADAGDLAALDSVVRVAPAPAVGQLSQDLDEPDFGAAVTDKELLDVRGFFVSSGEGIYDGARRDGEEPGESYFVDVQDYETGMIRRVWGVALRDVMARAKSTLDLQPGSRVHLSQRGKREMIFDSVNAKQEMEIRKSFANDWTCTSDRGPLPSQLAHLMAGVNVDALLDRLALRHGMSMDDQRLPTWKQSQMRLVQAFGDDPETIKGWFASQMGFSSDEERALVAQALALEGYGAADAAGLERETESRLKALRSMEPSARFDYLVETARPHLLAVNKEREQKLSRDVVESIDKFCVMALPKAEPDSAERRAMRSGIVQCIEGLTPSQQADYLSQRCNSLLQQLALPVAADDLAIADDGVSKHVVIDATKLSKDEYQSMLEKRLALATTPAEREAMVGEEIAARAADSKEAEERLKPISDFYQKIVSDRDVDMTAHLAGRIVSMLADAVVQNVMPSVKTLFQRLGGVAGWRRQGCMDGLDDLKAVFAETKETPVYQAFLNDPQVRDACGDVDPGALLAQHPEMARTDALQRHIHAQELAESPPRKAASPEKGLWAKAMDSAHTLSDRISHLAPEHLLKDGKVDLDWVNKMQKGLGDFAAGLQETLMPEKVMKQLQEMLANMMQTIKMLMEMARSLFAGKSVTISTTTEPGR